MYYVILAYVALLATLSFVVGKKDSGNNDSFISGGRQSKWYLVAFGMIGTSISGISLISVPGLYTSTGYSYMAMVFGFFFGYLAIAQWLLPMFYKSNKNTIYGYFQDRFGENTFRTISVVFFISKLVGASARLFIALFVLHSIMFASLGVEFWQLALAVVFIIFLYTMKSGIKTIVYTDAIQTLVLILALILIFYNLVKMLPADYSFAITSSELSPPLMLLKDFVSGIFITFVMTGLDQEMMQKNLSCRNIKEAQNNIRTYGFAYMPINFILLLIGALIVAVSKSSGIALPQQPDAILPYMVTMQMGQFVLGCFVVGVVAASFSSADSAMTSLTTMMLSLFQTKTKERSVGFRKKIHFFVAILIFSILMLFSLTENNSIIDTIYKIVGYSYGPILGAFLFGKFTKIRISEKLSPYALFASPVITFALSLLVSTYLGYSFGYEILLINGSITMLGLYLIRRT